MSADTTPGLAPCPFCGGEPSIVERPDNIDGTEFFYALACYCGGYSACAHKMAVRKTPEQAKADAITAWNRRAPAPAQGPTDAEIDALLDSQATMDWHLADDTRSRMRLWNRLVLARWGAPAASGEPAARKPLSDEQVEQLAKLGPVYAPDGVVSRRPEQYRSELESAFRRGVRAGEDAHGIKP